jgi:hypothetical protein
LQRIRPYNGFYATFKSVEQDHQEDDKSRYPERQSKTFQYGEVQDVHHQVQPGCGAQYAGKDKERCAYFIRSKSQPHLQVIVDGGKVHLIIDRE